MTVDPYNPRQRPRRQPRRRWPKVVALLVAFVVVFAAGLAIGSVLDDGPKPGGSVTIIRTIEPLPAVTTG